MRTSPSEAEAKTGGPGFWIAVAIGAGIGGYGLEGLIDAAAATRPVDVGFAAVGLDLLHDAVLAPVACVVGVLVSRWLPPVLRRPVRAGLFASLLVLLVGWAPLRGYGRDQVPDNLTVDPLNYASAVLTVLAVVWAGVIVWAVVAVIRPRRRA